MADSVKWYVRLDELFFISKILYGFRYMHKCNFTDANKNYVSPCDNFHKNRRLNRITCRFPSPNFTKIGQ